MPRAAPEPALGDIKLIQIDREDWRMVSRLVQALCMNWHLRFWRVTAVLWFMGLAYIFVAIASRRGEPAYLEPFSTVLNANTGTYVNAISTLAYWEEIGTLWVFICSWSVIAWGAFYTVNWMVGGFRRY